MKGHVRKRGEKWYVVFDLERGPDGRRRQKWQGLEGATTKRQAEEKARDVLHDVDKGIYVEATDLSVKDYLEQWLNDMKATELSQRSFEVYRYHINRHLVPELGHIPLAKLNPMQIQAFVARSLRQGGVRKLGRALSPKTVSGSLMVLHNALEKAVEWQMLNRNPADAVKPPRVTPSEVDVLSEEETAQIVAAARGTTLYVPVLLAIGTGMRRGEILALRWRDVDLDAGRIHVLRAFEQTNRTTNVKEPKTRAGRRAITLPEFVIGELRRHKVDQKDRRAKMGAMYHDHDLVCDRGDGELLKPTTLSGQFYRMVRKYGLPHIRFHALRHGHASHLLRAGVPMKVVSERLGHSSIGITMDRYSHVLPGMQEEAAEKLDKLLGKKLKGAR